MASDELNAKRIAEQVKESKQTIPKDIARMVDEAKSQLRRLGLRENDLAEGVDLEVKWHNTYWAFEWDYPGGDVNRPVLEVSNEAHWGWIEGKDLLEELDAMQSTGDNLGDYVTFWKRVKNKNHPSL